MPFNIQTVSPEYTYNRNITRQKLAGNKVLAAYIKDYDDDLDALEVKITKQIVEIYDAAFKSTIPIRGQRSPSIKQRQKVEDLLKLGKTKKEIANIISASPEEYGGTLRNKHIDNNLSKIRKNNKIGVIFIDDELHTPSYNKFKGGGIFPASIIAKELEKGSYTKYKLTKVTKSKPVNSVYYERGRFYKRSRSSDVFTGFTPIPKGAPTGLWIEAARRQAEPILETYLKTSNVRLEEYVKAADKTAFGGGIIHPKVREYVENAETESYRQQQAEQRSFTRDLILKYVTKRLNTPEIRTHIEEVFGPTRTASGEFISDYTKNMEHVLNKPLSERIDVRMQSIMTGSSLLSGPFRSAADIFNNRSYKEE